MSERTITVEEAALKQIAAALVHGVRSLRVGRADYVRGGLEELLAGPLLSRFPEAKIPAPAALATPQQEPSVRELTVEDIEQGRVQVANYTRAADLFRPPQPDHLCFDCGHPVSHHSGQHEATGCGDCDCERWFVVTPAQPEQVEEDGWPDAAAEFDRRAEANAERAEECDRYARENPGASNAGAARQDALAHRETAEIWQEAAKYLRGLGMSRGVVYIARCPNHGPYPAGLHGAREDCFDCGGPVERVPMLPIPNAAPTEPSSGGEGT